MVCLRLCDAMSLLFLLFSYIVFAQMLYTAILLFTLFCSKNFLYIVFAQMLYTAVLVFMLICY